MRATHTSGRAHHISRATASTASAPPNCLPSDSKKRSSRSNSAFGKPRIAPTRGSCSGATAMPRRTRIGPSHRAQRVQNPHSASKKSQPSACRPFPSVNSDASEIMCLVGQLILAVHSSPFPASLCLLSLPSASSVLSFFRSCSSRLLLLCPQQCNHLPSQFHHPLQRSHRHPQNLLKQSGHRRQKFQHALQPLARVRITLGTALQFLHAFRQHPQRRINLPPLPLLGHNPENLPDVLDRLKV